MSDIAPIAPLSVDRSPQPIPAAPRPRPQPRSRADKVEVSDHALFLAKLREAPIRKDLVEKVKRQIADGTYESIQKITRAADELARDLDLFA